MGGGGGEMRARVGGEVSKYIQCCSGEISFKSQEFLLLMTIADSPLLGQSPSGLNFYDVSGRTD